MSDIAKISMKIGEIEISIEGPSEFVSKQYEKVESHLSQYKELSETITKAESNNDDSSYELQNKASANTPASSNTDSSNKLPESFGQWLNLIPKDTSETDKALLAGYYIEINSENGYFRSRDVSKLLKDHGIKLSNTSRFVKLNAENKRTFQHSKSGNEINYKLSREGVSYLKELINSEQE